jgi:hypothetical protein
MAAQMVQSLTELTLSLVQPGWSEWIAHFVLLGSLALAGVAAVVVAVAIVALAVLVAILAGAAGVALLGALVGMALILALSPLLLPVFLVYLVLRRRPDAAPAA